MQPANQAWEIVPLFGRCFVAISNTLPLGESSLSEERAGHRRPPLA